MVNAPIFLIHGNKDFLIPIFNSKRLRNLDPEKISDPAFLRRLGYKIQFQPLPQESYIELWQRVSKSRSLAINDAVLDAVLNLHKNHNIGYFPCLPKDLIGICRDIIVFEASELVLTPDLVQQAWEVYFTADGNGGGAR